EAPAAVPPLLLGYNVYREGASIAYVNNANTLEYYDFNLNPGIYHYTVKAYYDVNPIAPGHDNSGAAGPVEVVINYGRPLPFYEPWDMGTFTYNTWSHAGNWTINTGLGNPAPSADFSWTPGATNYDQSLESVALSASPYTCAKIYFDFDYKLLDRNHTGAEYLTVEQFIGGTYKKVAEYSNNGDVNWTSQHFELKSTIGKAFKVRFRAHGANSLDILHWYIDNIKVYAVCTPPSALAYTQSHNTVNLSWAAPNCVNEQPFTIIWDDGSYESGWTSGGGERHYGNMFPLTPGSSGYLTSFDVMFNNMDGSCSPISVRFDVYDDTQTLIGSSAPFTQGTDVWQNVTVPSIPFSGTFYGLAYVNNTGTRPNYSSLDTDGPHAADDYGIRVDAAGVWQTIGAYSGTPGVFLVRANGMMFGKDLKSFSIMPGQTLTSKANTTTNSNSSEMTIGKFDSYNQPGYGLILPNNPASGSLQGYNVYRTDSTAQASTFHKLNSTVVSATAYTDIIPLTGLGNYKYYVTSVYNDSLANAFLCESPGTDTIAVQFPHVGIVEIGKGQIMVYPNPATDNVNVKSDYTINAIEVMNYTGQTVYNNTTVSGKTAQFNVSNLQSGIYFVKVSTEQGARSVKITVIR
ncbi:MAG: T9SS type A sorting domain-containing protein, partial [Bacteroidales bacterium]